jgi:hypothetical protein
LEHLVDGTGAAHDDSLNLTGAAAISVTQTVTDGDGDTDSATSSSALSITFKDDGPQFLSVMDAVLSSATTINFNGLYDASFGADGLAFLSVALGSGGTYGGTSVDFVQSDAGSGVTKVDVINDLAELQFSFYFTTTTDAVSAGGDGSVEFHAFSTLASPDTSQFFTLIVNPDGTYTFDMISNMVISSTTVDGDDFSAGGPSGSRSTPDGSLTIYGGDADPAVEDVNSSNLGIGVEQTTMSEGEWLRLEFDKQQTAISFKMTQWGGNGAVVISMFVGGVQFDFDALAGGIQNLSFDKPNFTPTMAVVEDAGLAGTWTYAGGIYTLYVADSFDEVRIENVVTNTGGAKFGINSITYDQEIHVQDLALNFNLAVTDLDGDTATLGDQLTVVMNDPDLALSAYTAGVDADAGVVLVGNGEIDSLIGGDGDDILIGGMNDDLLSGGLGNDTFLWNSGETGVDHITDFHIDTAGVNSDVLDLSQLLTGLSGAADGNEIDDYLTFAFGGGSTTITVFDTNGSGVGVVAGPSIVLDGVDLSSGAYYSSATPATVIDGLLSDHALKVDAA